EQGKVDEHEGRIEDLPTVHVENVEGVDFVEKRLALPRGFDDGYHRLRLDVDGETHEVRLIAAPHRCWGAGLEPTWGVFLPTHAVRTARTDGAGDLTDLGRLADFVAGLGGGVVGTLPMLATFLDEPFDASPYAPVSRLFWNELYLDPERCPELEDCREARERLAATDHVREGTRLREQELVDYHGQMVHRRAILEPLARHALRSGMPEGLERFRREHPRADEYARFRAVVEERRAGCRDWPERLRDRHLQDGDWDRDAFRYHLYVQWRLDEQLRTLAERASVNGPGLYLDLPLGVHPDGYDAWAERDSLLGGVAAGAPPDDFFTRGQNWGFAPFDPEGIRRNRYDYLAACLRTQMRHAGVLRIDHVMWMHRIFCVPDGMEATEGLYVRYRPDEVYAVLSLESHRNQCIVLGEDLGTVPDEVRETMAAHDVLRMYVLQYEVQPEHEPPVRPAPRASVACMNTHDMHPFAAFWEERDVDDRIEMGLLDQGQADAERSGRRALRDAIVRYFGGPEDEAGVLREILRYLASSEARVVLANLEDLWLERLPQNVPGTGPLERPNWRRRARHTLEELTEMPEVVDTLRAIDQTRRGAAG
ncbi:MAG: 4-alpha-glucanotransferase, partial [Polyangiales bacterium]